MVLDIGGGTSEVGVISLGGLVYSTSLRIAGDKMDEAIISYVRRKYGLLIGEATAEKVKIQVGTAWHESEMRQMEIKGRHIADGVPRSMVINSKEVLAALSECLAGIVTAIKGALEQTRRSWRRILPTRAWWFRRRRAAARSRHHATRGNRPADRDRRRPAHLRGTRLRTRTGRDRILSDVFVHE